MGKVWFVGAGPGDAELITVKGMNLLSQAGAVLYAGSLVSQAALRWVSPSCEVADSKSMTLEEITVWLAGKAGRHATVVRLQTGDPSLYGALMEVARPLKQQGIEFQVVPGVSSAFASAAAAGESLTLPEVTQSVIFTRTEGRTPMPAGEDLAALASHHCSLCIFLSATLTEQVQQALREAGWAEDSPILIVQKASWPEGEQVLYSNLADLKTDCQAAKISSQAMIIASPTLGAKNWRELKKSKLYAADFAHRFRKIKKT